MRFLMLSVLLSLPLMGQGSQNFTVDPSQPPSATNFQTLAAATGHLRTIAPLTGPVVFNVASTVFNETLVLTSVSGLSSVNTVSFVASGAPAVIRASAAEPEFGIRAPSGVRFYRVRNFKVTGYIRAGLYVDARSNSSTLSDSIFDRVEFDDGSTAWPFIRGVEMFGNEPMERNLFVDCAFRAAGAPFELLGYDVTLNRCEFDGKGTASSLLEISAPSFTGPFNRITNCFLHDCDPAGDGILLHTFNQLLFHNTTLVDTAGSALVVRPLNATWSRAPVCKNNIIVNHGVGSAIRYTTTSGELWECTSDYNCIHAPNSVRAILVGSVSLPLYAGSLANFLLWQPSRVQSGGALAYGANSIEANPGLVRDRAPYDIHLTASSPLIDRGTLQLIPAYSQATAAAVVDDFEGDGRSGAADIGADEVATSLTLVGSGLVGTSMRLDLAAQFDPGRRYQVATSLGTGPIIIGTRFLRLNFDSLLLLSVSGLAPGVFGAYAGTLDASGRSSATIEIPDDAGLRGVRLFSAFITFDAAAPEGVSTISPTRDFAIG